MILLFCWTKGFSYPAHSMKVKKMVKALVAITLVFHIIQLYLQIFLELLRGFSFALIDVTFKCLLRSLITRFSFLMSLVKGSYSNILE